MKRSIYTVTMTVDVPIYGDGPSPEEYLKAVMAQAASEEVAMFEYDFDALCGAVSNGRIEISYKEKV